MITETSRVGEHGTVVIPAPLCRRFGIEEGTLVVAEEREDGVLIRPIRRVETYSSERRAEFLLSNAVDAVDYALAREEVRKLGLDPDAIPHSRPD
jgi:AbrB family looped-hinge helix DNA binding protein